MRPRSTAASLAAAEVSCDERRGVEHCVRAGTAPPASRARALAPMPVHPTRAVTARSPQPAALTLSIARLAQSGAMLVLPQLWGVAAASEDGHAGGLTAASTTMVSCVCSAAASASNHTMNATGFFDVVLHGVADFADDWTHKEQIQFVINVILAFAALVVMVRTTYFSERLARHELQEREHYIYRRRSPSSPGSDWP